MFEAVTAICLILVIFILSRNTICSHRKIEGKNIWLDKGRATKSFYSPRYQLTAKPDAIQRCKQKLSAWEYKSRKGKIYQSDIIQVMAASLAARESGYAIDNAVVQTATMQKTIPLPVSNETLYSRIEPYVETVRRIHQGKTALATPQYHKCRSCGFSHACTSSAYKE